MLLYDYADPRTTTCMVPITRFKYDKNDGVVCRKNNRFRQINVTDRWLVDNDDHVRELPINWLVTRESKS